MTEPKIRITITNVGERTSKEFPPGPNSPDTWREVLGFVVETLNIPPSLLAQPSEDSHARGDWAGQSE